MRFQSWSLGKKLVSWFLLVSLVPLVAVSFFSYRSTRGQLRDDALRLLASAANAKTMQVQGHFARMMTDLEQAADDRGNTRFLSSLEYAQRSSGQPAREFVRSYRWALLADEYGADLDNFVQVYGYHDAFLIDSAGNVLFSVRRESDLGTNLVEGVHAGTRFGAACREALETGRPVFSDLELYEPSGGAVAGFLLASLMDTDGERIGLVAFQIPNRRINSIVMDATGMGETFDAYLVGEDLLARSANAFVPGDTTLVKRMDTELTRSWLASRGVDEEDAASNPTRTAITYEGPHGDEVLGLYSELEVGGVSWAIVTEIATAEAFAASGRLRLVFLALLSMTALLVLAAATVIARNIARPVRDLDAASSEVAGGDLGRRLQVRTQDEIGSLAQTFNRMVDSLRESLDDARWKVEYLDQVPSPVVAVDRELKVLFANRAAAELVGRSRDECVGQRCSALFGMKHCDTPDCRMTRCWQAGAARTGETVAAVADGEMPVRYTCGPLRDEQGTIVGGIEFLFDMSAEAEIVALAGKVADGDLAVEIPSRDEDDRLAAAVKHMTASLRASRDEREEQLRHTSALSELKDALQLGTDVAEVAERALRHLCERSGARVGTLYVRQGEELRLVGSHAYTLQEGDPTRFELGSGLVGKAAQEGREVLLEGLAGKSLRLASGLVDAPAAHVLLLPFRFEQDVLGVVELGFLDEPAPEELALLREAGESIGIAVNAATSRTELARMLQQTEAQSHALEAANEELQAQQEELKAANEELQVQEEELRQTNEELEEKAEELGVQGEELRQANDELEEKARMLEEQQRSIRAQNTRIEKARKELEVRAEQLALTSRYKSEFLANMSHELRTPLNSMLILSSLLADNPDKNLTRKQVEYAETVHSSGSDLLVLINEILDLAKIESGTMDLEVAGIDVGALVGAMERSFEPMAGQGEVSLVVDIAEDLPGEFQSDERRLKQVLKNLLSNAFKFTQRGSVTLSVATDGPEVVAFAVTDTGIGIPVQEQQVVFEAFQQVDGSSSRRYGGTGLGLSISREIATLLGGELVVSSAPGEGSTFTLRLPIQPPSTRDEDPEFAAGFVQPVVDDEESLSLSLEIPPADALEPFIDDDRDAIEPGQRTVLLIEDDAGFACGLRDLARERGFRVVVAGDGESGLSLAFDHPPDAVILDIGLPGVDGYTVLERLKADPRTRPVPVHVVSAAVDEKRAIYGGAVAAMEKPVDRGQLARALADLEAFIERSDRQLLLVEDDAIERHALAELLTAEDVRVTEAQTGAEALELLQARKFDCMVLDLGLPGVSGFEVLQEMETRGLDDLPVVVYTGRELTRKETTLLGRRTRAIVVKDVRSPDRLLQETALFLHRVNEDLPKGRPRTTKKVIGDDTDLQGKRLLVVDDDLRNIFALTSVLEARGAEVAFAENGQDGLTALEQDEGIDAVLMDIMMPGMDGYEAMRAIRQIPRLEELPVIALTAKAMRGDRQRCLDAGASDYIAKPVDVSQLLSLLRVWLYER
jgi:PAS domain S-box-containing protein